MMRFATLFVAILSGLLSGCEPDQDEALRPWIQQGPTVLGSTRPSDGRERYFLLVRLRVASIEVPLGAASESEEIWSYLNEEPLGVARLTGLGRNGFRVGVGRGDSWLDLAKILKRLTGRRLTEATIMAVPGKPVPIVLKQLQGIQTIFTFYDDRTLSGADYPPGDNLLTICCTLNEDEPTEVLITGAPQIRSTERKTRIVKDPGGLMMVAKPDLYNFGPLTFQVSVPSKDFFVIGPGPESIRATSVAHHFLIRQTEGLEFETVLIIMPEVFLAPVK